VVRLAPGLPRKSCVAGRVSILTTLRCRAVATKNRPDTC